MEPGLDAGAGAGVDAREVDEGLHRLELAANILAGELGDAQAWDSSEGFSQFVGGAEEEAAWADLEGIDDAGYLVGRRSPIHVIALFPVFAGSEVSDYAPVAEAATDIRDRVLAAHPQDALTVELTGLPMLTADEHRLVGRGLFESGAATALGVFLMLTFAFRSLRQSVVTLVPLGVSMGIALGVAYLVIGHLNAVTSGLFAVLLGLALVEAPADRSPPEGVKAEVSGGQDVGVRARVAPARRISARNASSATSRFDCTKASASLALAARGVHCERVRRANWRRRHSMRSSARVAGRLLVHYCSEHSAASLSSARAERAPHAGGRARGRPRRRAGTAGRDAMVEWYRPTIQ